MKKILKFILNALILILIASLAIWLVMQKGWQWWLGVAIFFGFIGVWLAIVLFKNFLAKRKMQEFVARVVEQDITTLNVSEKFNNIQLLKNRWIEAISLIKMSKAQDIPWYIMLGGTESGKTSAIKNAKLNTSLTSNSKGSGISKTDTCEWWFLEKSIILDTTSRYVTPEDDGNDLDEWKEFLNLFLKYRKRKPINGVVITISAEKLLNSDPMDLHDEGQNIRKRIDNLMRICWSKFPVYIMITKVDKLFGFNETFDLMSNVEISQAAGYLNNPKDDWKLVIEKFFDTAANKLAKLRNSTISKIESLPEPGVMLIPQEFLKLKQSFYDYVQPIFDNNAYQEQPLCRGIYFSSAKQEGSTQSNILKYNDSYVTTTNFENTNKGVFLRDFFNRVLPEDGNLVRPAYNALRWKFLASSVGVISIISIAIAIGSLMTASYLHNVHVINMYYNEFKTPPTMTNDVSENLITLDSYQRVIRKMEKSDRRWFTPPFGLKHSDEFIIQLKAKYVELYKSGFLNDFDKNLYERMDKINDSKDPQDASMYIAFLTARIDSANARLTKSASEDNTLQSDINLQNLFPSVVMEIYPQTMLSVANVADDAYISYIAWSTDKETIQRNQKAMLRTLRDLLMKDPVAHVIKNQHVFIPFNISLSNFWGSAIGTSEDSQIVPGMFTKDGLNQIKKFLLLVKQAGVISGEDDPMLSKFWSWYQEQYYSYWYKFIEAFNEVDLSSFNEDERKNLVISMTGKNNPYSEVLSVAAKELAPTDHLTELPDWAKLIVQLDRLKNMSAGESTVVTLRDKVFKRVSKLTSNNEIMHKEEYLNNEVQIAGLINEYQNALSQITPDLISDDSYLRYVGTVFAEYNGKEDPKSEVSIATIKFTQLQQMVNNITRSQNPMVWHLEAGPLNFMLRYLMDRTSCAIEDSWEDQVMSKVSTVQDNNIPKVLLDKNTGLLWKFLNETLTPFVNLDRWGYSSKYIFNGTIFAQGIDINSEFLSFANFARPAMVDYQSQYNVRIATVPVTVNQDANIKPYGTILSVQCADGEQTLKNYNYPNQTSINWSPDKCGDTTISILFSNFTLTKTYSGSYGFTKFLTDFKTGAHQFTNSDFAESSLLAGNYKVDWIQVKYKINQNIPALNLLNDTKVTVPQSVTSCGYH